MPEINVQAFRLCDCLPDPTNRPCTFDDVREQLESIRDLGQVVPGIVRQHPEKPGKYVIVDGHRRAWCLNYLKAEVFYTVLLAGDVSEPQVIKLRLTTNQIREKMSVCQVADDLLRYKQLTQVSQDELAGSIHLDPSTVSRALATRRIDPSLRPHIDNFEISGSVAYYAATIPSHEDQRVFVRRCIDEQLTRDQAKKLADEMRGKKPKRGKAKALAGTVDGRALCIGLKPADTVDAVIESLKTVCVKLSKYRDAKPESLGFLFGGAAR